MPALLYALLTAPVEPNAHVHWAVKWLATLSGGETVLVSVGTFVTTVIAVVWPIVRAVRKQRKLDMEEADKPTVPQALPPPAVTLDVVDRIAQLDVRARMAEWTLDQCRAEYKRARDDLQAASEDVQLEREDHAKTAAALTAERSLRERLQTHVDDLASELAASEKRALALAAELAGLKHDLGKT